MSVEIPVEPIPCDVCECEALLEDKLVSKEPFGQFERWFNEAHYNEDNPNPEAMCLSTVNAEGKPSGRMIQLKGYGKKEGFKFFTRIDSKKSRDMEENPNVALTFYWPAQQRTVRIEGVAERLPKQEADEFFEKNMVLDSQVTSNISPQSAPLPDRAELWRKHIFMTTQVAEMGKKITAPTTWGGYTVRPQMVEFCQGHKNRLSDRIRFRFPVQTEVVDGFALHPGEDGWVFERLAP